MADDNNGHDSAIRYVVVVHGMGEPKQHSTLASVISRLAEARRPRPKPKAADNAVDAIVPLGRLTGETGARFSEGGTYVDPEPGSRPWMEFDGIPTRPTDAELGPFLAEPLRGGRGENLRFVSVDWFDISRSSFEQVGEPVVRWSSGLAQRLKGNAKAAHWASLFVDKLSETLSIAAPITKRRAAKTHALIFDQYLGDVQVYAEFSECRGRAIRRFHETLAAVKAEHVKLHGTTPARFTVIAHSLGSVMAWESLLRAHAKPELWDSNGIGFESEWLPGYVRAGRELPDLSWIDDVDAFATMGSPIDKFITLFWQGYEYLGHPQRWMRSSSLEPDRKRIAHFNFVEEQDPVGHHLDAARATDAHSLVFDSDPAEDRVYTRSFMPGYAHIAYWKDRDLFRWILRKAIDEPSASEIKDKHVPTWNLPSTFRWILFITYFAVPIVVILVDHYMLNAALQFERAVSAVVPSLAFLLACWLGRRALQMLTWWRRILIEKRYSETPGTQRAMPNADAYRARTSKRLLASLWGMPVISVAVTIASLPGYIGTLDSEDKSLGTVAWFARTGAFLVLAAAPFLLRKRSWTSPPEVLTAALLAISTLLCTLTPAGCAFLYALLPVFAPVGVGLLALRLTRRLTITWADVTTNVVLVLTLAVVLMLVHFNHDPLCAIFDHVAGAKSDAHALERIHLMLASLAYISAVTFTYTTCLYYEVRRRVRAALKRDVVDEARVTQPNAV